MKGIDMKGNVNHLTMQNFFFISFLKKYILTTGSENRLEVIDLAHIAGLMYKFSTTSESGIDLSDGFEEET